MVVDIAKIIAGEDGAKIFKVLTKMGRATDDQLSLRTNININLVRKTLYALHDTSLIANERIRDDKTGWFIFYWRPHLDAVEGFIIGRKRKILEKLQVRLDYEKKHDFYNCVTPNCRKHIPFEEAAESMLHCPACGGDLVHEDNSKIIETLKKRIAEIEKA